MKRKNIEVGHQMLEYIWEGFSRNLQPQVIIEVWNFIFKEPDILQLHQLLLAVALLKYYQEDLLKCKRLR